MLVTHVKMTLDFFSLLKNKNYKYTLVNFTSNWCWFSIFCLKLLFHRIYKVFKQKNSKAC